MIDERARERRLRLVHTLRSTASWRNSRMAKLSNGVNADEAQRSEFRANYRSMTAVQCAAVYVEQCMDDLDDDLEFLEPIGRLPSGALDLCERSMAAIRRFGMEEEPWEDGGPDSFDIRELLAELARHEDAVREATA